MISSFNGAVMPICGVDVLIVVVRPWVLADLHECQLFVFAFFTRFQRPIVLMAQDDRGVPHYFGPMAIVRALCALPFEIIPWQRIPYRQPPPRHWMLPIPRDPEPMDEDDGSSDARDPRSASAIGRTLDNWQEDSTAR